MIISIRYISDHWHWELYAINVNSMMGGGSHADGKYAQGTSPTWANMIHNLELSVAELERRNELTG